MFDVMRTPSLHEAMIKIGAYVLSEFGYLIADQPGKSMQTQFGLILQKMPECSIAGKGIIMTAFIKMTKNCPDIIDQARRVFELSLIHI